MATWPSKFPRAQRKSYTGRTEIPVMETKFPASTKRRRLFESSWTFIELEMFMDSEQFQYFWAWLKYKADEGADIISMPVLDSDITVTNIDGYIVPETITWEFRETVWNLSFDFRIPSFSVPLETSLDTWLIS